MTSSLHAMAVSAELLPKAVCMGWDTPLIWLQAAADSMTMMAYLLLPLLLVHVLRTRPFIRTDPIMVRVYVAYAAFIFCGGVERGVNIAILWWPDYYVLQTIAKWATAAVTIVTGSLIASTLIPGLIQREMRITQAEDQIQALLERTKRSE